MWPQEHLHLLAPRAALLCEGTAFKKVSKLSADKLKTADESGIKLLVSTLGGSWGKTALEEKYDTFEKAIYSTAQKADETNDSYLARQGIIDENEAELDAEYVEAMVAVDDPVALAVQGFEEELEGFFQDNPDLQEALVSYLEARQKLLSKKRSRGFWPVSAGKGSFKNSKGSKGRGKGGKGGRDQLLARIARSHCRICGAKGHWKAECPQKNKSSASAEATTTVAEAIVGDTYTVAAEQIHADEVLDQVPPGAMSLAEALITWDTLDKQGIASRLRRMVANVRKTKSPNTFPARLK